MEMRKCFINTCTMTSVQQYLSADSATTNAFLRSKFNPQNCDLDPQ